MSYPQILDYNEAVQNPATAFANASLRTGQVALTPLGLPQPYSGGFALTYSISSGGRRFAVRCFHREVPEAQARYAAISAALQKLRSPYFVDFDFEPKGIRIRGQSYPIVRMDWVEGRTLGSELGSLSTNPSAINALRQRFVNLAAYLEANAVAHGDIQNDNVIVNNGELKLIDYDGMFVSSMQEGQGSEIGQRNFQHPERAVRHFGPKMDRFSFIVVDVSLEALAQDGSLFRKFSEGGAAIIFKANDFADPASSEVFRLLHRMPALRESSEKLAKVCQSPMENVPTLADFIAGRNIPTPAARTTKEIAKPAPAQGYISAYDVLNGKDYDAVLRRVGDKIELVGQITSVKSGTGKRGKGRGRPYVFINFGVWNQRSVKITVWSEGLSAMTSPPTEAWVGRWISVTGLIEPPYDGKHYGRPYQSVGPTVASDSQIVQLTENQARFRLQARSSNAGVSGDARSQRSNESILEDLLGKRATRVRSGTPPPARAGTPPAPTNSHKSRNAQILAGLNQTGAPGKTAGGSRSLGTPQTISTPPPPTNFFAKIPGWVWVVGGIILVVLLMRRR